MRHTIKFDSQSIFDVGASVAPVTLDHQAIGTPVELGSSVMQFIANNHSKLKEIALNFLMEQHSQTFFYEDGTESRKRLTTLLSGQCIVAGDHTKEPWRFGDALRLELILQSPQLKHIDPTPEAVTEWVVHQLLKLSYRRLHALEAPIVQHAFKIYSQIAPTQLPLDVLLNHSQTGVFPSTEETINLMRENSQFWKIELMSHANAQLAATIKDPSLMTLQSAAAYNLIKEFFLTEQE